MSQVRTEMLGKQPSNFVGVTFKTQSGEYLFSRV